MDTKIELIVFAPPSGAAQLLESFAKCAKDNITEPGEKEGFPLPIHICGYDFPAHRQVEWVDMDTHDAIDEWVEDQEGAPPFVVILGWKNHMVDGYDINLWCSFPGQGAQISRVAAVEEAAIKDADFSKELIEILIENNSIDGLRAHIEAIKIGNQTPRAGQSPSSRRI